MFSGLVVDQRHSPISNAEGRIVDVIQLSRTPELGPDTMCCSCGLHGCRFRDMPQLPTLRRARSLDRGDSWMPIDQSKHLDPWMKPLVRGTETDMIDIPGNWYLDDLPPRLR